MATDEEAFSKQPQIHSFNGTTLFVDKNVSIFIFFNIFSLFFDEIFLCEYFSIGFIEGFVKLQRFLRHTLSVVCLFIACSNCFFFTDE